MGCGGGSKQGKEEAVSIIREDSPQSLKRGRSGRDSSIRSVKGQESFLRGEESKNEIEEDIVDTEEEEREKVIIREEEVRIVPPAGLEQHRTTYELGGRRYSRTFSVPPGTDITTTRLLINSPPKTTGKSPQLSKSKDGITTANHNKLFTNNNQRLYTTSIDNEENTKVEVENNIQKPKLTLLDLSDTNFMPKLIETYPKKENPPAFGSAEFEIFEYENSTRMMPSSTASEMRSWIRTNKDIMIGSTSKRSTENIESLVEKTIAYLEDLPPLPPLIWSDIIYKSCASHIEDIGPEGILSHIGSDNQDHVDRIQNEGILVGRSAENIVLGGLTAKEVVFLSLIHNLDGSLSNPKNLFNPNFHQGAVAVGSHRSGEMLTVFCYAELVATHREENKALLKLKKLEREIHVAPLPQGAKESLGYTYSIQRSGTNAIKSIKQRFKMNDGTTQSVYFSKELDLYDD